MSHSTIDRNGEKLGVLIIVENLPVPFDRRVWQEACALRDMGFDVTVICPQMRGYVLAEEQLDGIQIYRHWISEEASGIVGFFKEYGSALWGEIRCAWKAWRRKRFAIIHLCNPPDLLFLVALPFKLFFGTKVVFDVHDVSPEMFEAKFGSRGPLYWGTRAAEKATLKLSDKVIATNQSVRDIVQHRGSIEDANIAIVRTSPKTLDTRTLADERLKNGRPFLVGYIGVMGNADGVEYLLEAARYIVHQMGRHDISFLLMGTGPEWDHLVRLRDRFLLHDFVKMPGRVSDEYLAKALRTIDMGVSCDPINSYNDHCTMNKVLEYMAFGKAQIMFDLKEGRFSAQDAAVYVPDNSSEELALAILKLIDDESKRVDLGRRGFERLTQDLAWEYSVAALRKTYMSLL